MASYTEADFDRLSFHDCHIRGLEFRAGDSDRGEWVSDLVLDIDYILEWICGVGGGGQFRVAPATLTFEGATDLSIAVNWGESGFRCALHQPYWPAGGVLAFGAAGFTLCTRGDPVLTDRQKLSLAERHA